MITTLIIYPSFGRPCDGFINSLNALPQNEEYRFKWLAAESSDLINNRNQLLKIALQEHCDYTWKLDDDTEFTFKDFIKLKKRNKPIVFGAYKNKLNPKHYVAGYFQIRGVKGEHVLSIYKGFKNVNWAGLGCVLIKTEELNKIEYPYVRTPIVDMPDGTKDQVSDSLGFCMHLKDCGYDIWLDCDVELNHLTRK